MSSLPPAPSPPATGGPGPGHPPRDSRLRHGLDLLRSPQSFDGMLALFFALISAAPYLQSNHSTFLGSIVLCGSLAIRRSRPRSALTLSVAAALLILVGNDTIVVGIVVVPVLVYSFARWSDRTTARLGLAAGLLGSVLGPLRWFSGNATGLAQWALVGMTGLACATIVAGGYLVGRRRQESLQQREFRIEARREQERLAQAEQLQRARAATVDERNRIARELHDIVAHSLSVIVVQAEGGKALAAKRPERAPEVLETIAETSREALAEMRQMVGLLRSGDPGALEGNPSRSDHDDYRPPPGLGDLAELVRKTTDRAQLSVDGPQPVVSQAVGLTCYRIVQESLTNVLKHAGPNAHAVVGVHYAPDRIEIAVSDDGRGAAAGGDGLGHGLQGMRERVGLHGGTLSAGPASGGGFAVWAALPLEAPRPSQPGIDEPMRRGRP